MKKKKKSLLTICTLLAIILLSDVIFSKISSNSGDNQQEHLLSTIKNKDIVTITDFTGNNYDALPREQFFKVETSYVIDGDTVIFSLNNHQIKCRLIGIDTPESQKRDFPVQPYALEATRYTEAFLAASSTVYLELEQEPLLDQYDRLLVHVFNQERELLQNKLLEKGLGRFVDYRNSQNKYKDLLVKSEQTARNDKIAVWSLENYVLPNGFSRSITNKK